MNVVLYFQSQSKASSNAKLAGVQEVAEKVGWLLQIINGIPNRERFTELVQFWNPIGCIAECGGEDSDIDPHVFDGLPTVFFDRNPYTLPSTAFSVSHDSQATGAMAARELLMTGYRQFAFIHPPEPRFWSNDRERGFAKALKTNGISHKTFNFNHRPGAIAKNPNIDQQNPKVDLIEYQRQLRTFLGSIPTPCAIFAANDRTAAETIVAIRALDAVPLSEFSIIGVDNFTDICEHTSPKLTSIEADFRGGGNTAALMLLALLRCKGKFIGERRRTFGPSRIIRRASTRDRWIHDPQVSAALDLIADKACQGLTAAKVIEGFACSRDMAEIRFRKATGQSILTAIQEVRLERAKSLLRNPLIQIKAVADFCGFKNPNSLRKFFRKETGMTMREWRKTNHKKYLSGILGGRVANPSVTYR